MIGQRRHGRSRPNILADRDYRKPKILQEDDCRRPKILLDDDYRKAKILQDDACRRPKILPDDDSGRPKILPDDDCGRPKILPNQRYFQITTELLTHTMISVCVVKSERLGRDFHLSEPQHQPLQKSQTPCTASQTQSSYNWS